MKAIPTLADVDHPLVRETSERLTRGEASQRARLDAFINDMAFFQVTGSALKGKGWDTGYSVSCTGGGPSADFHIDDERFVQMGAVVAEQGV